MYSAISKLTHAVTRCKFEATDVISDEIVLSKILKLLRTIALTECGRKTINDKGICEMVEVAFGMYFQSRVSELLRKSAEETLLCFTQVMFERLVTITKDSEYRESILKSDLNSRPTTPVRSDNDMEKSATTLNSSIQLPNMKPFGLPAISELIRVLVSLIDPSDRTHTDTLHRPLALLLFTRGLEIGGKSLSKWISFAGEYDNGAAFVEVPESVDRPMKITPERERQTSIICIDATGDISRQGATFITPPEGLVDEPEIASSNLTNEEIEGEKQLSSPVKANNPDSETLGELKSKESIPSVGILKNNVLQKADKSAKISDSKDSKQVPASSRIIDNFKVANSIKTMVIEQLCRFMFQVIRFF